MVLYESNILLHEHSTFHVFIHLLMGIWIASPLGLSWKASTNVYVPAVCGLNDANLYFNNFIYVIGPEFKS